MKTTIEIDGCEIVIEKEGETITVSACKGGECVEEFTVECGECESEDDDENLPGEEAAEESEEEADFAGEEAEEAEEDAEEAEEDAEEAEEEVEEPKLESFSSFVSKKKRK